MQNHNELLDDSLIVNPIQEERRAKSKHKSFILLFLLHFILPGAGLFYVDSSLKRCWFYFALFLYGWFSYINITAKFIPELAPFHDTTAVGSLSFLLSWNIAYGLGALDASYTLYRYKK